MQSSLPPPRSGGRLLCFPPEVLGDHFARGQLSDELLPRALSLPRPQLAAFLLFSRGYRGISPSTGRRQCNGARRRLPRCGSTANPGAEVWGGTTLKLHISRFILATAWSVAGLTGPGARAAGAHPSLFSDRCASCHSNDTQTCTGCHHHRGTLTATPDRITYRPGDPVVVRLGGGSKGGWIRALLYNSSNAEIDRRAGPSGDGDNRSAAVVGFPVELHGTAPAQPGTYTWQAAWYGNVNDNGSAHGENRKAVTIQVVAPTPIAERNWGWVKSLFH